MPDQFRRVGQNGLDEYALASARIIQCKNAWQAGNRVAAHHRRRPISNEPHSRGDASQQEWKTDHGGLCWRVDCVTAFGNGSDSRRRGPFLDWSALPTLRSAGGPGSRNLAGSATRRLPRSSTPAHLPRRPTPIDPLVDHPPTPHSCTSPPANSAPRPARQALTHSPPSSNGLLQHAPLTSGEVLATQGLDANHFLANAYAAALSPTDFAAPHLMRCEIQSRFKPPTRRPPRTPLGGQERGRNTPTNPSRWCAANGIPVRSFTT